LCKTPYVYAGFGLLSCLRVLESFWVISVKQAILGRFRAKNGFLKVVLCVFYVLTERGFYAVFY
jgi:hypothetical protein